jgi:1-acyl-sn-glycerol-3-phosphate acyltransferase
MYTLLRGIMRLAVHVWLARRFHASGLQHVPRRGPLLVCSNHISTIDPPLLPAFLPRSDTWSMAKAEWFHGGIVEWLFTSYHAFPIVRHTPDRKSLRRARSVMDGGGALVIYPEGHRQESGRLARAEPGAGFLARSSGVPVVPAAVVGSDRVFPRGARWPRFARLEIRCGAPIRIRERRPDGTRVDNQDAADAIMLAIARLLPEGMRGAYADVAALEARLEDVVEAAQPLDV